MSNLEDIGFYTLSDRRARSVSSTSRLERCELLLTARCNFRCLYCRGVGGEDISFSEASDIVRLWGRDNLQNIRFSGGEPTLWPRLSDLCSLAENVGIRRIAVSTNGSAPIETYDCLLKCGVNDFSVSLDACCAEDGDSMAGGNKGAFDSVVRSIRWLSQRSYTTVGVVLTANNADKVSRIIQFADGLGVSDIRVIPAAQEGQSLPVVRVSDSLLQKYPILAYRMREGASGAVVRGLPPEVPKRCALVLDDMAVCQGKHYPCICYMRESGKSIGGVGADMRAERRLWYLNHNIHDDPICRRNCLDVCVAYNKRVEEFQGICG